MPARRAQSGLRHGEAASLRWRQYDDSLEPLGGLSLEHTKTQVPRRIPVHPTLARVLSEWKSAGFERTYGRAPTAVDLVVPTRSDRRKKLRSNCTTIFARSDYANVAGMICDARSSRSRRSTAHVAISSKR